MLSDKSILALLLFGLNFVGKIPFFKAMKLLSSGSIFFYSSVRTKLGSLI